MDIGAFKSNQIINHRYSRQNLEKHTLQILFSVLKFVVVNVLQGNRTNKIYTWKRIPPLASLLFCLSHKELAHVILGYGKSNIHKGRPEF